MTTIILVILGVLIAAAAVLFMLYYGGDGYTNAYVEAEAARLVGEGQQISSALELHYRQEGFFPRGTDPIEELIGSKYLTHRPLGKRDAEEADKWAINYDAGMVRLKLGKTDDDQSMKVCLKARQQLDLPEANTASGAYRCDGSDSPGGKLSGREPCCVGEVAAGGGTANVDVFANVAVCSEATGMPVGTAAEQAAYIRKATSCVEQRIPKTNTLARGLADIGNPIVDKAGGAFNSFEDSTNGNYWYIYRVNYQQCQNLNWVGRFYFNDNNLEQCADWNNGEPYYYYKNMKDIVRPRQVAFMEAEAKKIMESWKASTYAGSNMGSFVAAGGYKPDMLGNTAGDWSFWDDGNGGVNIAVKVHNEGVCNWFRAQKGYSWNKFEYTNRTPSYCYTDYWSSVSYYQFNVSVDFRAKQKAVLERERRKLRAAYLAAGGNIANIQYTPQFDGITPGGYFQHDIGRLFYIFPVGEGLCNYLVDTYFATGSYYYNQFDWYYRPVMCHNYYGYGHYAMLDVTVD